MEKEVDSKRIFKIVSKILKKIKKNLIVKMGGSLTAESKNFVYELYKKRLVDRVETRNIELKISNNVINNFRKIIESIFNF